MLDEYLIELRATQILDMRTEELFSEVLSRYAAGNYRSSVVMLWSVAVCDLLFKLQNPVQRAQRHGLSAITSLRLRIGSLLARVLPRCPCCIQKWRLSI